MKKHGFTLAELLIVLGIAGVVAAVILPAINGLMPDKTKINYLKVYDELGSNIKSMVADTSLFPILLKEGSTDIDVSKYPLVNNSQPLKAPFKDDTKYSGDKKFCNLLAFSMGVDDSCKTTSYPAQSSFTTSNGMEWWISQTKREINTAENKISYQTDIYVDVDSSKKSSNCMYGEDNCKQPDRFKFLLAADGRLVPADPVGVHYINTRKNLLKKKFEAEGEVMASLEDSLLDKNYNISLDNESGTNESITEDNSNNNNNGNESGGIADNNPESRECSYNSALSRYYCKCGEVLLGKIINCAIPEIKKTEISYETKNYPWSAPIITTLYYDVVSYTLQYPTKNELTINYHWGNIVGLTPEGYGIAGRSLYSITRTFPAGTKIMDMAPSREELRLTSTSYTNELYELNTGAYGFHNNDRSNPISHVCSVYDDYYLYCPTTDLNEKFSFSDYDLSKYSF